MNYKEVLENAKKNMAGQCQACAICDGVACGNKIPGPGSKAPGNGAHDNYMAWQKYRVMMDTILPGMNPDTSSEFLGHKVWVPIMPAPTGNLSKQFNPDDDIREYNDDVFKVCGDLGCIPCFGNGIAPTTVPAAVESMKKYNVPAIPVLNPILNKDLMLCIDQFKDAGCAAFGVVVDSAGLAMFKGTDAGLKSIEDLRELKEYAKMPMMVKGVISAKVAEKAVEAGADAIVVSNHGGRVLPYAPSTADVLAEIADAVKGKAQIVVDGGIRNGVDMFRAFALGADMCMMMRPMLIGWYGGKAEGVECLIKKLQDELSDTMKMCGAATIKDIKRDMVKIF